MTEDQKLAQVAWECVKGDNGTVRPMDAIRILRDECGWTLRYAVQVLASLGFMAPVGKS